MREMKDSGVEWIGEIPIDWNVGRIKYNYYLKGRIGWQGLKADEFIDEGPYLVTGTDFEGGKVNWNTCYHISQERYDEAPEIHVNIGDLLITKDGTVGKVAFIDDKPEQVSLNSHLLIMRPLNEKYNNRYLFWVIQSPVFDKYFGLSQNGTIMASLSQEKINDFSFALPSENVQKRIVGYLDSKCAKIDSIIEKQQAIIEKLKEYKLSVITEAVTKGIISDVEMKDSGVEWIGNIPISWTVGKTLYALSMPITDGPHETPELYDEGIPFVSAEAVSCGNGVIDFDHIRGYISKAFYEECCKKYVPQMNDIYMIKSGATTGKVAIVDTDKIFTIWSPLGVFRCNPDKMYYMYLYYFLQSDTYQKQVQDKWTFGTQQNIGMRSLEKLMICFPSIEEQKEIAEYIYSQCKMIEKNISTKQVIVEKLKEYKKSLIYEVVTGKKELPV